MTNINVKKPNGEIINAELISYFELVNLQKKYVFYTMNEKVENDLIKMYVAEVEETADELRVTQKMTEEEWTTLKGVMKAILTGNKDTNIRYLKIEGE